MGQLQKAMPRLKIFREEVKLLLPTPEARQKFWRNHLTVETFEAILKGEWMTIEEKLDHEISGIRSKIIEVLLLRCVNVSRLIRTRSLQH